MYGLYFESLCWSDTMKYCGAIYDDNRLNSPTMYVHFSQTKMALPYNQVLYINFYWLIIKQTRQTDLPQLLYSTKQ